jgi:hypothetical protein
MTVESRSAQAPSHDHVVQFYVDDAGLVSAVGPYVADALAAGEVAIVIATEAHRRAFAAVLEAAGIDLQRAAADGRLVTLDAASTLAAFRSGTRLDRGAFRDVVGGVVRRAVASGRAVRAYGEMVALLWDAGDVVGALELEAMWNELGRELPFSLFCAYPAASVAGPDDADALHEVCGLHASVVPSLTGEYPAEASAPGVARRTVTHALRTAGCADAFVDLAALVVTEMTTNAVVHARTPFSLAVSLHGSAVRIAVADEAPGDGGLVVRPSHGLAIIETVATRWGSERVEDGKVVWAELAR